MISVNFEAPVRKGVGLAAGDQLGLELLAKHARRDFAARSCDGLAAERSIYMYAPISDDLRSRPDDRGDDEIAMTSVEPLTRANRVVVHQCRGAEDFRFGLRSGCGGWLRGFLRR
jgi:hypothetical protein